jgi:hypothetical protein
MPENLYPQQEYTAVSPEFLEPAAAMTQPFPETAPYTPWGEASTNQITIDNTQQFNTLESTPYILTEPLIAPQLAEAIESNGIVIDPELLKTLKSNIHAVRHAPESGF